MKNTKAILLIVLGSFIIATGFAFAETDKPAMAQLKEWQKSIELPNPVLTTPGATKEAVVNATTVTKAAAPTPPSVTPPPPAKPAPTFMEKTKKYIGDNFSQIVSAAAIGFIAMLVIGTGGAGLLVGLLAFGLFMGMKAL